MMRRGLLHGLCLFTVLFFISFVTNKFVVKNNDFNAFLLFSIFVIFFLRVGYLYRKSTDISIFESILSGDKRLYGYPVGVAIVIVATILIGGVGAEFIDIGGVFGVPILILAFLFGVFSQMLTVGTIIWIGGWFYKW